MSDLLHDPRPSRSFTDALERQYGDTGWLVGTILTPIVTVLLWAWWIMVAIIVAWMIAETLYFFAAALLA